MSVLCIRGREDQAIDPGDRRMHGDVGPDVVTIRRPVPVAAQPAGKGVRRADPGCAGTGRGAGSTGVGVAGEVLHVAERERRRLGLR